MKFGPVPGHAYALSKRGGSRFAEWEEHLQTRGYAVKPASDPRRGKPSRGEIEKLTEVSERYRSKDHWELSELTHDFPEWSRHWPEGAEGGSHPIPWEDILRAQGEGGETIKTVEEEETARAHRDDLFGAAG